MSARLDDRSIQRRSGAARGYSHGVLAPAGSRLLFVAGQVGWDREQRLAPGGFAPQFERALENIRAVVECAGGAGRGHLSV